MKTCLQRVVDWFDAPPRFCYAIAAPVNSNTVAFELVSNCDPLFPGMAPVDPPLAAGCNWGAPGWTPLVPALGGPVFAGTPPEPSLLEQVEDEVIRHYAANFLGRCIGKLIRW